MSRADSWPGKDEEEQLVGALQHLSVMPHLYGACLHCFVLIVFRILFFSHTMQSVEDAGVYVFAVISAEHS